MKKYLFPIFSLFSFSSVFAQHKEFYAYTNACEALQLKERFLEKVQILETKNQQSAIFLTDDAAEFLHKNVLTHGSGYVYKSSK